jgi:hypothetical protein
MTIVTPKCAWDAILTGKPYPVKAGYLVATNPVYPETKSSDHGWDVSNINMLTDNSHESMDPVMGATNLRVLLCRIYRCEDE